MLNELATVNSLLSLFIIWFYRTRYSDVLAFELHQKFFESCMHKSLADKLFGIECHRFFLLLYWNLMHIFPGLNVYFVCFDWFPIVFMKLLGEFLLDPAWHCNVVNNPIMLAPSLLQGSIGKSRKGNLVWDTNLFLGGAVLPASPEES